MQKANLKTVDESFVEHFFEATLAGDGDLLKAPEPEGVENNVLKTHKEDFSILDLEKEEEVEDGAEDSPEKLDAMDFFSGDKKKTTNKETKTDDITYINKLIEEGVLLGFDEDEFKVKTYDDVLDVVKANREEWKRQVLEEEFEKEFSKLPAEFQYAVDYIKNGGTDVKSLFKVLSKVEEAKSLDPDNDPKGVVREYLEKTNYGTPEEIQDQIEEWEDTDLLTKKAKIFQPKIEKLAEAEIKLKLEEEAETRKYQKELADSFFAGVEKAVKADTINGIALSKEEKLTIYKGLTENSYVSSYTGQPMNLLGKFLEKITWDAPDYETLAELTLFAKDPKAYREKIKEQVKMEVVADKERKLRANTPTMKQASREEDLQDNKLEVKKLVVKRPNSILRKK